MAYQSVKIVEFVVFITFIRSKILVQYLLSRLQQTVCLSLPSAVFSYRLVPLISFWGYGKKACLRFPHQILSSLLCMLSRVSAASSLSYVHRRQQNQRSPPLSWRNRLCRYPSQSPLLNSQQ